ncbi:MAG: DNA polymerase III subunit chi [Holosporales bacterium]|jgi:DNA polymerase-3 subunit chi|nr:DNA polymerase III subunit chi [Holosporales bacterium]
MPNKSVIFYSISSEFSIFALKLIEKTYDTGENILFLCDNDDEVQFFDSRLWIYSRLSFIPHGSKFSLSNSDATFCQTWVSSEIEFVNAPQSLLHNGFDSLEYEKIRNFEKVIDVFDKKTIESAKKRAELYKDIGFASQKLWEQNGALWTAGSLLS